VTTEPISRPEFENAFEGVRREIQAMGEHIAGDLGLIRAQLQSLLDTHFREAGEVAEIKVRVKHAEDDLNRLHEVRRAEKASQKNNLWLLYIGVAVAIVGHFLHLLKPVR